MADDNLPDPPWTEARAAPPPAPVDRLPDPPWAKPEPKPPAAGPMPGPMDALIAGLQRSIEESGESAGVLRGQAPTAPSSAAPSPAAAPFEWSDVLSPYAKLLPKTAYQLGATAPTLAGGIAGGVAGGMTPAPGGALIGGAAGAGLGAAFQAIGPVFGEELRKSPNDPDGAWDRSIERAGASGLFSSLGWAAFPLRIAQGPLKNLAFQAFGVQPGVAVAGQATQNILQGQPVDAGLGEAYTHGAVGTLVPMLGHRMVSKAIDPARVQPALPPVDEPKLQAAQDRIDALYKETPRLQREAQQAYDKYGLDAPETVYSNYKLSQHQGELFKANADFTNVVTPPAPDPSLWDKVPFINKFRSAIDQYKRTFQPELVSDLALQSEGYMREYNAMKAQRRDSTIAAMDDLRLAFHARPEEANIEWIKSFTKEGMAPIPPDLQEYANVLRDLGRWVYEADKNIGSKMGYVEDYLPREWEHPDAAKAFFNDRVQSLGPTWFQKGRTLDYLQQGLDAGLKLKTTNPVDLMTNRLLSSAVMRGKVELLRKLSDIGAAKKLLGEGQEVNYSKAGWQIIKDPIGDRYALHPDAIPMWQNAVEAKGLWSNEGVAGNVFRGWMGFKNYWVPIKLGLSAFHLLHVAHIAMNDSFARAWNQAKAGDIGGAAKSVSQALTGWFYFPEGQKAREAWLTPEWRQTPEQKAIVKLMVEGGFSPQLSEQLRMQGQRRLKETWAENNPLQYVPRGAVHYATWLPKQLFGRWIPNLKTAAYVREAEALFKRRPDLIDDTSQRRASLGAIAKSVDNRFGEMFYSNLFWNRTLKDVGIGSFLSLGWNLGFLREFGGGAVEPFLSRALMTPTQEAVNAARSKTSFALMYFTTAAVLNAAMTKAMTGEDPEGMDYFMPRMGGTNPDGSPRRLSNMYYTREVPMLKKHIEEQYGNPIAGLGEMIWNKMLLQPIHEIATNRDNYGYNIVDPASPIYTKAAQLTKYILSDQFNPITIMGAKRALKASGKWDDKDPIRSYMNILTEPEGQLAMLGFGPAPSYVSKTPAQNKLSYLFAHYVSPEERPQAERKIME